MSVNKSDRPQQYNIVYYSSVGHRPTARIRPVIKIVHSIDYLYVNLCLLTSRERGKLVELYYIKLYYGMVLHRVTDRFNFANNKFADVGTDLIIQWRVKELISVWVNVTISIHF